MQDLRVIGVENGALLVTSEEGVKFRIPIDEVMQAKLRQAIPDPGSGRKLAPREIQAHIRSGMSAQDVASVTGVPLEYIQKFEGPVLAERDFVVNSALNVPVHTAMETEPLGGSTFGTVIRERLYDLGAVDELEGSRRRLGGEARIHCGADRTRRPLALRPEEGRPCPAQQRGDHAVPAG
jgi:hypothetical protein